MSRRDQYDKLGEPHKRGQATEAILKAEFLVRDISVLSPEYDNEPYDFVIDVESGFHRIQAKTAYWRSEGAVCFETVSTKVRSDGYDRDGYGGEADTFAVYNPVLDEMYLVPVEDAPKSKMKIRFSEPANGQQKRINWHEDYLLDTVLDDLRFG